MKLNRPSRKILTNPGMPLKEFAKQLGVAECTLHRWRRKAGIICTTRGEKHWNAKLKQEDIPLIQALYMDGLTQQEIADKFSVAQPTISDIIRRETWI